MLSWDFARCPTRHVHPAVDLALNFHKKISLYYPSSLNISEGGSLLSFCIVVVDIWVSSTSFQKIDIGSPQQPPTEIVLLSVKNWIFDDSFHKKRPVLVILVPGMIQPSQSEMFLMKWGCKVHSGHGGCWGCGGHWGCRGCKVWKIYTEDFGVIQVLEFSFILMCWKNIDLVNSWNIILKFTIFFGGGCWGQLVLLFWKLVH